MSQELNFRLNVLTTANAAHEAVIRTLVDEIKGLKDAFCHLGECVLYQKNKLDAMEKCEENDKPDITINFDVVKRKVGRPRKENKE